MRHNFLSMTLTRGVFILAALLPCAGVCAAIQPLALQQTRYEIAAGQPVPIAASGETLDFLLKSASRRIDVAGGGSVRLVAGPNHAHNQILLATPCRTAPGEYTATLSAVSATGEARSVELSIVVKPRQTVPSGSNRPPVVLLNGWEIGFTGTCTVSTSSSDTFGNLAQYLISDGVPIVYLFDNCVEGDDETLETLAADLATFLATVTDDSGAQVPQIDLVGFSIGGLIARAYLAGLQPDESLLPPIPTLVRKLVLIATPNFGSFVAGNYSTTIIADQQALELVPASAFLWNLATWNQRGDDLRGVDALAVVGNAGAYLSSTSATTQLNNATDGLVSLTSAALGFALPDATPTRIVPYCHVDPSTYTNTIYGTFNCNAAGIANVTSTTQETGEIVRSFLSSTSDWQSIGGSVADDPYLSTDGGIYFAVQDVSDNYLTDITSAAWGTVALTPGGDTDTVYYTDFVNGTGDYVATSTSTGTINCGSLAESSAAKDLGFFSAARCKIGAAIFSIGPLAGIPGRVVNVGATITLTGNDFGTTECNGCQILATPAGSSTATALPLSGSWSNTALSAVLPASITGLVNIAVQDATGIGLDSLNIMVGSPVTNAASFQPGFASATWVSIFGSNLASGTQIWQASDFVNGALPTSLGGVTVTINGVSAYVYYVSPTQINVLAPDDTTMGAVTVQVNSPQGTPSFTAVKQPLAPAFFTIDNGAYVAAIHTNGTLVGTSGLISGVTTQPAAPGETIELYGTGFGPTNPALPTGQLVTTPEPLASDVTVLIGGVVATVPYAGLVEAGLNQINVTVPSSLSSGDYPIVALVGGVQTQTGISITVQ
jgi:uncharacterized protein (TIGR03437 family)